MMDSGVRGSEKPEDNESGLKRLENLIIELAQKMKQDSSELKQELAQKTSEMNQDIGELTQLTSAVVVQMNWSREKLKEGLVALRRQYEGSTEVVQSRVDEVREVVAAQESPVSDQQLCGMTGHCELSLCCRHGGTWSVGAELPVWECSV